MTACWLTLAAALSLFGTAVLAQSEAPYRAEVVEYGIYSGEEVQRATGINETMQPSRSRNICHVMTTTDIPNSDETRFGVRYRVDGPVSGERIKLRHVVRFPNHLLPEDAPQVYVTNVTVKDVTVGTPFWTGWINHQTRPGIWIFELLHNEKRLAGIVFNLLPSGEVRVKPDSHSTCFPVSKLITELMRSWV